MTLDSLLGLADRSGAQVLWYEYDGAGRLTAAVDAAGRRVEYAYTDGQLSSSTDVLGNTTSYEYHARGRITGIIDPKNYQSSITYDKYDNVAAVVDPQGRGHFFEYDYDEGTKQTYVRVTSSAGRVRELWYDRNGTRRISKLDKAMRDMLIYFLWETGRLSHQQIASIVGGTYSNVSRRVSLFKAGMKQEKDLAVKYSQIKSQIKV